MKAIGVQIQGSEIILVVLQKHTDGSITQLNQSTKFGIADHTSNQQIRQFRDQITATLDSINADFIGVIARNASTSSRMKSSPVSFKLEGIIQLYPSREVEFVWPQSIVPFFKKNQLTISPKNKYQQDALELAFMLLTK